MKTRKPITEESLIQDGWVEKDKVWSKDIDDYDFYMVHLCSINGNPKGWYLNWDYNTPVLMYMCELKERIKFEIQE